MFSKGDKHPKVLKELKVNSTKYASFLDILKECMKDVKAD